MKNNVDFKSKIISELEQNVDFKSVENLEFFKRVHATPTEIYEQRLKQIKFHNNEQILDAGCGFGQWTLPLSSLNKNVIGFDLSIDRVKITNILKSKMNVTNLSLVSSITEQIPFKNNSFDCIFCYSVIYSTNYEKTLKEFFRILKPNGKLYLVTNDLGWYLKLLFSNHNSTIDYSSRKKAYNVLKYHLLSFFRKQNQKIDVFLPPKKLINSLKKIGFKEIILDSEGKINSNSKSSSFYSDFMGFRCVYEVISKK